jgi:hypothetical protein
MLAMCIIHIGSSVYANGREVWLLFKLLDLYPGPLIGEVRHMELTQHVELPCYMGLKN